MHGYTSRPTAADTDVVGKRVGAAVVDSIIGFVLYFVLSGLFLGGGPSSGSVLMAFFVLPFTVFVGYYILFEGVLGSATIGKRLFGIEVVKETGGPIDVEDAVIRNVLRFVDGACYYVVGFFFITTSDRKQRLGDRLASTVVVASSATHGTGNRQPHHGRSQQATTRTGQAGSHSYPNGGRTGHRNQQTGHRGQQARQPRDSGGQRGANAQGSPSGQTNTAQSRAAVGRQRHAPKQGQSSAQHGQPSGTHQGNQQPHASPSRNAGDASSGGAGYRPERNSGASS